MIKGFTYFLLLCNIAEEESAYFVHKMKETFKNIMSITLLCVIMGGICYMTDNLSITRTGSSQNKCLQ